MRRSALVIVFLLLCCHPAVARADDKPADLTAELRAIRERHPVPALAAGVWKDGHIVALGAVGLRRLDKDVAVTTDDAWHIGSCTKAMTATLAALLVQDGALKWDSTVGGILGDHVDEMADGWDEVTLEQLLNHRGGAPEELPEFAFALRGQDVKTSRQLLVRRLLHDPPQHMGEFHYSNAGYTIAGRMLEVAGGDTWEKLLFRRVFDPLEIRSAGFGAPGMPGRLTQPRGHRPNGTPLEPSPFADNPLAIGPAGTVHLSISGWLAFVAIHLQQDPKENVLGLSADSMQKLHTTEALDENGRGYVMGWGVAKSPGIEGPVLMHDGSNTLWYSSVWASPGGRVAIVAVANEGGDEAKAACKDAIDGLRQQFLPPSTAPNRD